MNDKVAESDPLTPGQKWGVVKIFGSLLLGALAIFGTAGYFLITTTSERVAQAAVNSSVFRELVHRSRQKIHPSLAAHATAPPFRGCQGIARV
ncbi:MAG TPA: hypothetical protein VE597_08800, partial [Geminicoccaceae bacterium]|nr:hypothetical protein [Geminicoccaceae bacterium]